MPEDTNLTLGQNADNASVVHLAGQEITTVADLAAAVSPDGNTSLDRYCEALNHLEHGTDFRVILDPAAYVARYDAQLASEDPNAPWQEGVTRLRDFGRAETARIQPPRQEGGTVVFFVEDAFLGIPYQVTAPAPGHPEIKANYEPVPTTPLPPAPSTEEKSNVVRPTSPPPEPPPPAPPRQR